MKFLFDQSADFRLIAHLRRLGHDLSAVSREYPHGLADDNVLAIAVLEKGRLRELGSFDDLMGKPGLFADLWHQQFRQAA